MEKDLKENALTRRIIGLIYDVYNQIGYGFPERVYQKAFEETLKDNKINYSREKYGKILFDGHVVGKYFIDFLIADKIVVELKVRNEIYQNHINQLLGYLKSNNLQIGLLFAVTKGGIAIKRIVN